MVSGRITVEALATVAVVGAIAVTVAHAGVSGAAPRGNSVDHNDVDHNGVYDPLGNAPYDCSNYRYDPADRNSIDLNCEPQDNGAAGWTDSGSNSGR